MNVARLLSSIWIEHLGLVLLHFVWQGAVIAFGIFVIRKLFSQASARIHYALSLGALLIAAAIPVLTMYSLQRTRVVTAPVANFAIVLPAASPERVVLPNREIDEPLPENVDEGAIGQVGGS